MSKLCYVLDSPLCIQSWLILLRNWLLSISLCFPFLPPANEVCEGYVFTGVCLSIRGGMRGFIQGACVVLFRGACMVFLGGGMHGFIGGACVVLFGGVRGFIQGGMRGFIWGGMRGFIWGACVVFPGGGVCGFFSVFSDTMRYGQWAGGTHPTGMHSCFLM